MKTISILGSGWLGLPLAKHFVEQGYRVKASSRSTNKLKAVEAAGAERFIVDIDRDMDVDEFLDSNRLIVNITSKNIDGFARLIEKIEKASIEHVLFISSTSVYHNTNALVSEADGAENSENRLFQIENRFCNNQYFQTTVIRFAGLFGYHRHPGRFFAERAIPQPDAPVNLIHRDDCISIIDQVISQERWGEVYNACADTHPSKRIFYSYARASLGLEAPEMGVSERAEYKIINNEKVKQALGYKFIYADLMTSFE